MWQLLLPVPVHTHDLISAHACFDYTEWWLQTSLVEARAAVLACQKLRLPLLEPPTGAASVPSDPVTGARKPQNAATHLQQLVPQVHGTQHNDL